MTTLSLSNPNPTSSPNDSTATGTYSTHHNSMNSIISLTLPITIKLNESNFLTWKSQILPLIHGYDLDRFLNSSPPATTRRTSDGLIEINLDYLPWHRQDQLLLGWLRSSLTETLLAQVVSTTSTKELWQSLEEYYASTSRARLHELNVRFRQLPKVIQPVLSIFFVFVELLTN
jgi:hypothetical protein